MNQLLFREKLTPPIWGWVALTGFCLMLAVSVSAVFGDLIALIVFIFLVICTFREGYFTEIFN